MLGSYSINVNTNGMPQKVASAFTRLFGDIVGAEYSFFAYLGSKQVNGINHAILAKQVMITGKDIDSLVLIVLNEKPGDVGGESITALLIDPLISNGGKFGGLTIEPTATISSEAKDIWDKYFGTEFFGSDIKPFGVVATQVVKGVCYIFAAKTSLVLHKNYITKGNTESIKLVKVFSDFSEVEMCDVIEGEKTTAMLKDSNESLGYAFTWLKKDWP